MPKFDCRRFSVLVDNTATDGKRTFVDIVLSDPVFNNNVPIVVSVLIVYILLTTYIVEHMSSFKNVQQKINKIQLRVGESVQVVKT